jgi:hypothetical protein
MNYYLFLKHSFDLVAKSHDIVDTIKNSVGIFNPHYWGGTANQIKINTYWRKIIFHVELLVQFSLSYRFTWIF